MLRKVIYESPYRKQLNSWGPVLQSHFLREMGIDYRMMALIDSVGGEGEAAEAIAKDYNRLIDGQQMGTSYKVWAVTKEGFTPAGFEKSVERDDDNEFVD